MDRLRRISGHLEPHGARLVAPAGGAAPDIVKNFELFKVPPRWQFIRIETRNGIVGWGEPNLEGFTDSVATAVRELMTSVVGQDPSRIQYIWQKLYRQRFYAGAGGGVIMSAIAGIDQGLWDIAGRTLGVPVHRLLGGSVRTRLRVYRWCGGDNNTPEDAAREAKRVVDTTNFKLLKMNACPRMEYIDTEGAIQAAVDRMAAVRRAVGPDIGIGLDFHGRVKAPVAKRLMKRLEPYNPLFYEEPVVVDQNPLLPKLAAQTSIPIATGERMFRASQFRDLLESRAAGIIQPDCSHAGGISHMFAIARMAEAYGVSLAPHCPLGPIALAACLAVDSCVVNFAFQETSMGIHYNSENGEGYGLLSYVKNPEVFNVDVDGFVRRLDGPGLGIEIDEKRVRAAARQGHRWKDREWELKDGTPTTW